MEGGEISQNERVDLLRISDLMEKWLAKIRKF